uniref:Uncharacterized protein n=1 Tax=Rhizophora mucronata TaxID=61149 RepID=A0A2P2J325_RHIMU
MRHWNIKSNPAPKLVSVN